MGNGKQIESNVSQFATTQCDFQSAQKSSMEITGVGYFSRTSSTYSYIASDSPPLEQETVSMTVAVSTMSPQHATLGHKELWAQPPSAHSMSQIDT